MKVNKIVVVVGTRPTFIELAPVIHQLQRRKCDLLVYHTGQHYDKEMSNVFMDQLAITTPYRNLNAGSGTFAQQISAILIGCEDSLQKDKPDIVIVEGDTNTAFASALAAVNAKIPVIHVEAGCRSFDKSLPEEINRIMISHISELHFPPTINCKNNLLHEGINREKVNLVGHPIVDSVYLVRDKLRNCSDLGFNIGPKQYYYVTVHRDFNTDNPTRLEYILSELSKVSTRRKIIFPVHPRTRKRIQEFHLEKYLKNFIVVSPVDYITSLSLTRDAYAVISDSGGLTKESCLLGIPYVSLRPNTEWVETLTDYSNQLAFKKGNTIMGCVEILDKNYDSAKKNMKSLKGLFGKVGLSSEIAETICSLQT